jgi:hypothetical protein
MPVPKTGALPLGYTPTSSTRITETVKKSRRLAKIVNNCIFKLIKN